MRWDDHLTGVFEDLEQQAEGLALAERDAEVAELLRAEYAAVDCAARLQGSLRQSLVLRVSGVGSLQAVLSRVGAGWCLLDAGSTEWVVRLAAVASLRGLAERAVPEQARPILSRLGLASALRGVAEARVEAVVHCIDGSATRGILLRVGADHIDLVTGEAGSGLVETVPFAALAAVRSA
ncbi:MAG TPA: hypothetical protein VER39_17330 [Nocardioidaceae bacterium]|nr:hypothetical protein [Nocardioidaceae bacterium]